MWGESGYIRLHRGDPTNPVCGEDLSPSDGSGCDNGPTTVQVYVVFVCPKPCTRSVQGRNRLETRGRWGVDFTDHVVACPIVLRLSQLSRWLCAVGIC